jgi:heptosyltransferase-2
MALAFVDKAGSLLRQKRQRPPQINNILIIFFGSFGDGLMFTSVLASLRERMPQSRIDVFVSSDVGAVINRCPYVSNIFVTDMPSGKKYPSKILAISRSLREIGIVYDVALCLRSAIDNGIMPLFLSRVSRYNVGFSTGGFSFCLDEVIQWRSGIHETEHFLDVIRSICPSCQLGPQKMFYDPETVRSSLSQKLESLSIDEQTRVLIVHPGSKIMRRSLSIERWRDVLTELVQKTEKTIIVTGISSEKAFYDSIGLKHPRIVPTFGLFSIPELAELIKRSSGVVTVETFVSHLAGISGVPAIAFWTGVTDVRQWRPVGENVTVASVGPACSPCFTWCKKPICMEHDPRLVATIFKAD